MKYLVVCALMVATTAPGKVYCGAIRSSAELPPSEGGGDMPTIASAWSGGTGSLPYNNGTSPEALIQHALGLAGTPPAMQALAGRGIRRADQDYAITSLGQSTVYFSFELPGVPIQQQRLILMVRSQAVQFPEGDWRPVTVIGSFVARDSLTADGRHIPVLVRGSGNDMLLYPEFSSRGLDFSDAFRVAYSMQEFKNSPLDWTRAHFLPEFTPAQSEWINGFLDEISVQAAMGMVSGGVAGGWTGGPPAAATGMMLGLAGGAVHGAGEYVLRHPYPPRR